jgi:lysophospholipase L1-like esterase
MRIALYILLAVIVLLLLAVFLGATNVRLNGRARTEQTRVACIGDSTTYGTAMPNNMHNSYPAQLQRLLGDGYHVANFGVHGKTVKDINDNSYRKTKQYAKSLAYDPDIVVLMMGANDTKPENWTTLEDFKAAYRALVETYMDEAGRRLIKICTPASVYPMKYGDYSFDIDPDRLEQISEYIIGFADENELELIDIYDITSGRPEWYEPDKVHPNKHGAKAIAASVFHWIADDI